MAYLDAVDVAAQLLIGSIERVLNQLADILDDTWYLADGPDAGISQETYQSFVAAAAQLRQVDLTIAPPEHT